MPDKNYKRGCGKGCLRCWRNKMNHANKVKGKKNKHHLKHEVVDSHQKEKEQAYIDQEYYSKEELEKLEPQVTNFPKNVTVTLRPKCSRDDCTLCSN